MAPPPQHSSPSSSTTPASTLVVERDGMVGSQHLQPQIQPPIPPIHQREREQQEEEEEEEQQESHTSPSRRRNSLPSSSATRISTRDINDINSDSRPRNRKWKRAKYVFFWIYDDHWIYVIWLSVVILFLSVMGWICKFRYLPVPSYMYSDLIMCFLFRSL